MSTWPRGTLCGTFASQSRRKNTKTSWRGMAADAERSRRLIYGSNSQDPRSITSEASGRKNAPVFQEQRESTTMLITSQTRNRTKTRSFQTATNQSATTNSSQKAAARPFLRTLAQRETKDRLSPTPQGSGWGNKHAAGMSPASAARRLAEGMHSS